MSAPCPKCGNNDISVSWHKDDNDCGWTWWRNGRGTVQGEHLHYTCRRCQYSWIGPTADSQPKGERE